MLCGSTSPGQAPVDGILAVAEVGGSDDAAGIVADLIRTRQANVLAGSQDLGHRGEPHGPGVSGAGCDAHDAVRGVGARVVPAFIAGGADRGGALCLCGGQGDAVCLVASARGPLQTPQANTKRGARVRGSARVRCTSLPPLRLLRTLNREHAPRHGHERMTFFCPPTNYSRSLLHLLRSPTKTRALFLGRAARLIWRQSSCRPWVHGSRDVCKAATPLAAHCTARTTTRRCARVSGGVAVAPAPLSPYQSHRCPSHRHVARARRTSGCGVEAWQLG